MIELLVVSQLWSVKRVAELRLKIGLVINRVAGLGDPELDSAFRGLRQVTVGYEDRLLYWVA